MLRDHLAHSLHHLGIDRNNYRVLKLLPLIHVAWADGKMDAVQQERIVALAHDYFAVGPRGEDVLRRWIEHPPTREYFLEGLHEIFLLAHAPDEWGFEIDELPGLFLHAEAIARITAHAMGEPGDVTPAEQGALADIARELGIDSGQSWANLMRELEDDSNAASRAGLVGVLRQREDLLA